MTVGRLIVVGTTFALLVGCGGDGGSDEDKIRTAVEDYNTAVANGDASAACDFLSEEAQDDVADLDVSAIIDEGKKSCESAVDNLGDLKGAAALTKFKFAKVTDIQIRGDTAQVELENSDPPATATAELEKSGDDWVISSAPGF